MLVAHDELLRARRGVLALFRDEDQRPAGDVGVLLQVVRVAVVLVVVADPPAVAEAHQQVAVEQAEKVLPAAVAGDLAVSDVVADEAGLGVAKAMYAATASSHQELPTSASAAQPPASSSRLKVILAA